MKLYQFQISPNAKRARVMALEVGADVSIVTLDFMKGEHMTPSFMAKNPNHKVPVLELDDGSTIWESCAILNYFADKHPEKKLLPSDLTGRTLAAQWMFWNASHLEPALFTIGMEKIFAPMMGREPSATKIDDAQKEVERYAPVLNARLEGREFLLDAWSIADISLATTIEFSVQSGLMDLGQYKHIAAWLARVQARDSWKKAG